MRKGPVPGFQSTMVAKPGLESGVTNSIQNSLMPPTSTTTSYSSLHLPGHQHGARALVSHVLIDTEGAERDVGGGDFRMKGEHGMRIMRLQGKEGIVRY